MPLFKFLNRVTAKLSEKSGTEEGAESDSDDEAATTPRCARRRASVLKADLQFLCAKGISTAVFVATVDSGYF
eukprot:scaffold432533_cov39-Prasinocladus_malaysianus.AAC.1